MIVVVSIRPPNLVSNLDGILALDILQGNINLAAMHGGQCPAPFILEENTFD
jgi:hypothetical protein